MHLPIRDRVAILFSDRLGKNPTNLVKEVEILHPIKARCWEPPGRCLCIHETGRLDCIISKEIGVNGDAYPIAISQKVTKNLPASFYSPMPGFKFR